MTAVQTSYSRQTEDDSKMGWPSRYAAPHSIDNWRHSRMLAHVKPLLNAVPDAVWMTLGDGRYGSDAAYLKEQGASATATSLTAEKLRVACEQGFIDAYRVENAEHISLEENTVDFVLCKEAYHHFPRPPLALYEMLRVARDGAVLIEPLDDPKLFDSMKSLIKKIIRGDREQQFEPSGNFLYRLNVHELCKLMSAMGGQTLAFKGINDFYHARLGGYAANTFNVGSMITRFGIMVQNALTRLGLLGFGLGCVVVFKGQPSSSVRQALQGAGFQIIDLPRNPYVDQ